MSINIETETVFETERVRMTGSAHLLSHVGDVVQDSLVLHQKVLLSGAPHVVAWESGHCGERGQGNLEPQGGILKRGSRQECL